MLLCFIYDLIEHFSVNRKQQQISVFIISITSTEKKTKKEEQHKADLFELKIYMSNKIKFYEYMFHMSTSSG